MSVHYDITWRRAGTWYRGQMDIRSPQANTDDETDKAARAIVKGLRDVGYDVEATKKHTVEEKL